MTGLVVLPSISQVITYDKVYFSTIAANYLDFERWSWSDYPEDWALEDRTVEIT